MLLPDLGRFVHHMRLVERAIRMVAKGDDGSHFQVIVVGALFDGMSRVKKQQSVYAPLMEHIASNAIHALSIKAFTPEEWKREKKFIMPS